VKGTVVEKILSRHLVSGELTPGAEISIRIAQTLTQDATGTMAYLAPWRTCSSKPWACRG